MDMANISAQLDSMQNELQRIHAKYEAFSYTGMPRRLLAATLHSYVGMVDLLTSIDIVTRNSLGGFVRKNSAKTLLLNAYEQVQTLHAVERGVIEVAAYFALPSPELRVQDLRKKYRADFKYINSLAKVRNVVGHIDADYERVIALIETVDAGRLLEVSLVLIECSNELAALNGEVLNLMLAAFNKFHDEAVAAKSAAERVAFFHSRTNARIAEYFATQER